MTDPLLAFILTRVCPPGTGPHVSMGPPLMGFDSSLTSLLANSKFALQSVKEPEVERPVSGAALLGSRLDEP